MSEKRKYTIRGIVSSKRDGRGVPNLRVEAWDKDLVIDDLLGTAKTVENGRFTISFNESHYQEICIDRKPDIYFKVYEGSKLVGSTEDSILWNVARSDIEITLSVNLPSPKDKVDVSFYQKHNWFTRKEIAFENLNEEEKIHVTKLLNEHLRSEILRTIGPGKPGVAKLLSTLEIDYQKLKDSDLNKVIESKVLSKAKRHKMLQEEIKDIKKVLDKSPSVSVNSLLNLDLLLKENPIVAMELRKAKNLEFGKIIHLKGNLVEKLAQEDLNLEYANEATLDELVREKILNEKQKEDLKLTIDLSRLTGGNIELIKSLKNNQLKSLEDFVLWENSDWTKVIKDSNVALPEGEESIESYAENLRYNIEKTFTTQYLLKRVIKKEYNSELKFLNSISALQKHNDIIIEGSSINREKLNWMGIDASKKQKIEKDLEQLLGFANTYRKLGIIEIINDKELNVNRKKNLISQRLTELDTFYKNNPNIDLRLTDFLDKNTKLNWAGIEESGQPGVKKQMMAYQRTLNITGDFETSQKLLSQGFDSALDIASVSEMEFLQTSGLDSGKGHNVYLKAQENTIVTSHYFEAIRDALYGQFKDIAMSNQVPLVNDLREIDGFDEIFGSQDYCDCEECRSILSPAAYFVDLMYFIQENVSKKAFYPNLTDHPLYLKNRRPDLWNLKLTCQNTSTEIPYLEVVNDVLEQYIKNELSVNDVYDMLRQSNLSSALPFNLPLEELRLYLSHFELSLYDVYKTLKEPQEKRLREKMKISEQELKVITMPNPAEARLRFGNQALVNFNVQEFIKLAGISRDNLADLLKIKFLPEITKVKVKVIKSSDDIQQYEEVLQSLTDNRLDLIHRFLRFWGKTSWTIREFDLVINALKSASLLSSLEEKDGNGNPKILYVSELSIIQEALDLSAEEVCVMTDELPQVPIEDNQKSLYERLFDLEKIFGVASVTADGKKIYKKQATLPSDKTQDKITPLLLAALGITESELDALFKLLQVDTTIDQQIDIKLISSLFRHARITRGLKLSVEDLIRAIKLKLNGSAITELSQIRALIEFTSWLKSSPFTASELIMILQGEESSSVKYQNNVNSVATAVLEIQKSDESDKMALLNAYLQRTFNLTKEQLESEILPKFVTTDINGAGITTALNANFTNDEPDNPADLNDLIKLVRELEHIKLLFNNLQFEPESITFLIDSKEAFGIADLKNLDLNALKNATFYKSLLDMNKDMGVEVRDILKNYQSYSNFSTEDIKTLSDLCQQSQGQIQSLVDNLTLAPTALEAVKFLFEAHRLCQKLGIEGYSLMKLKAMDYAGTQTARDVAIGAFASKYDDEKTRKEYLEPYTDKINTLKRDALCDYIIARRDLFKFNNRSDLYNFFLLDVEMSGCFRTSKLVAAISSVQLYVHRCLINLEQSDKDLNPAIVDIKVNPTWIPTDEWEWRKNYRVWEANRKVFLYPENYIDPTLRDNKTHIFEELEEELLQEKITEESAETAYKKYLSQFAELTKLRFAGAYYHSIPELNSYVDLSADQGGFEQECYLLTMAVTVPVASIESEEGVYYLFARTNIQPHQYYYRTYNHFKNVWGNWEKIELGIDAEEISALVHQGRLYIYWTETKCKEINKIQNGNSVPGGAIFKVFVKYSFLNENSKWSSPQRLYVGYTHLSENEVYWRVQNTYPTSEGERDGKHDYVFEQFEKKVFRKPYALVNNDVKTPIQLSYIWSQNQRVQQVKYVTDPYNVNVLGAVISVPSVEFLITNNQFLITNELYVNKPVIFRVDIPPMEPFNVPGTMVICNASTCVLYSDLIHLPIPVNAQSLPITIYASTYDSSLSKNEIINHSVLDIKARNNYKNINDASVSFLRKEYDVAFTETGDFIHYVENGTTDFTNTDRVLTQFAWGDGQLSILNNNGSLDTVNLTTILTDELSSILYAKGIEQYLSLQTQQMADQYGQKFDFKGAYGEYYWEMFFHIPCLIANHLNANQKFKEAKWWYERIFNPTAEESPADTKPTDHNWQFREFRGLNIQKLKDILTDNKAIEAYKKDPFNPHAIARLRLNAYQKAIVMKYIDNLIDWGDHLFAQDTRESINEANMCYQLAADILGERPIKLGKCETASDEDLTYEKIGPEIGKGSEFLITLENVYMSVQNQYALDTKLVNNSKNLAAILGNAGVTAPVNSLAAVAEATAITKASDIAAKSLADLGAGSVSVDALSSNKQRIYQIKHYAEIAYAKEKAKAPVKEWVDAEQYKDKFVKEEPMRYPGLELVKQSMLVFCVPPNVDLLEYWDRVEDRLFKIRHCMNISGVRRSLALFQPPIEPMMLVRARAAGLSLEDIMAAAGKIPVYRFSYLIEKTRQFTQAVQGFGTSLLSALEKKDIEELTLLRSGHERNILRLTLNVKKKQLQDAQYQHLALGEGLSNVQNRIDYYQGLVNEGLTGWETTQQVSKHIGTGFKVAEGVLHLMGAIIYLTPQVGNPFAMKYGGKELGDSAETWAAFLASIAAVAEAISASAGLEATFQRREQEWKQQLKLAKQEYGQIEKQILAAEIRSLIAEKDLEIHEKNMEQTDELNDFYKNKFTSLGLYDYLASTLNRLYRQAYNVAYTMAKMAESAYRFELDDDTIFIANDNWQFDRAGLLAGDKLLLQLQKMEQAYIENNVRTPEIIQSFSLALLDPAELINLRQTGSCAIKIPEAAFEVLYPGQYKRLIKSVKLSMPCVVGPYTNVSAKLTLIRGKVESEDEGPLTRVPVGEHTSISTSSAINDAGMFEFSFRDERYLPFEGSGAISEWTLELPSTIRSFDYNTISDVILHISYTARDGDRVTAENNLATAITSYASTHGLFRLFSLKHEFPNAFCQLLNAAAGADQKTEFTVEKSHFPYLFIDMNLNIAQTKIYLKPKKGMALDTPPAMNINGSYAVTWVAGEDIEMAGSSGNKDKIKGGTLNLSGTPVKKWTINAGVDGLDKAILDDILILIKYGVS